MKPIDRIDSIYAGIVKGKLFKYIHEGNFEESSNKNNQK